MSSLDRMLRILELFTIKSPRHTVEQAMAETGFSRSTIYRYFKSLNDAGLLVPAAGGAYALGPAVIEFDRVIRVHDPLLAAARIHMGDLARNFEIAVLVEPYRDRAVITHLDTVGELSEGMTRGVSSSLIDSAPGRVLLAHANLRWLRRYFDVEVTAVRDIGLGESWPEFRQALRALRRVGFVVYQGTGPLGGLEVAAPVYGPNGVVVAALGTSVVDVEPGRAGEFVLRIARRISSTLDESADQGISGAISEWQPMVASNGNAAVALTALRGRLA